MKLILRLIDEQRCQGCGRIGWVEQKLLICLFCYQPRLDSEKKKLLVVLAAEKRLLERLGERFSEIGVAIRKQLAYFTAS